MAAASSLPREAVSSGEICVSKVVARRRDQEVVFQEMPQVSWYNFSICCPGCWEISHTAPYDPKFFP